ncbi:MAG: M13 family metallopeptidase [Pseudomonadota bacterium]|nr:M13 family metallopeptidase [Pseudomonadota bacterium]
MDRSVAAGEDFYRYANGRWLESTAIPGDRSRWGNFDLLDEAVSAQLRAALEGLDAAHASADALRAVDIYRAFLDESAIAAHDLTPVRGQLDAIEAVQDPASLASALGATVLADVDPLDNVHFATPQVLGLWVAPDVHDTTHTVPYLLQGGLSLPDRDTYLDDKARAAALRARLRLHFERMLALAGFTDAATRAQAVLDLETGLARGHASRAESEQVTRAELAWTRADFASQAPGLDWDRLLAAIGLGAQPRIVVWHPGAMSSLGRLAHEVPLPVWRDWLRVHLLDAYAAVLPKLFDQEAFAMYGTALAGTPRQRARLQRALDEVSQAVPDALGQLYVAHHFPDGARARVQAMVGRIVDAFDRRIARLAWMAPATRAEAHAKLRALYIGVGHPEHWQTYDELLVSHDDPVGNRERAGRFHLAAEIARLDRPTDREHWCMAAQAVNAVNLPLQNALNFPAAILQPPFFDPAGSDAANFGAIGALIAHEISHAFDDEGARFDAQGGLRNWWRPDDLAHFRAASASLVRQYSAYRPLHDVTVDGQQTLSENIADVAGLAAAYDAFMSRPPASATHRSGRWSLSAEQEFFIAYAQSHRVLQREQQLRWQLVADGHAPPRYRAATVRNLDGWYRAFGVHRRQSMYLPPAQRATVW